MSQSIGNLLNCPTYRIEDRKAILTRIFNALFDSPDCKCDFKGLWSRPTIEEFSNWEARQTITNLLQSF